MAVLITINTAFTVTTIFKILKQIQCLTKVKKKIILFKQLCVTKLTTSVSEIEFIFSTLRHFKFVAVRFNIIPNYKSQFYPFQVNKSGPQLFGRMKRCIVSLFPLQNYIR